MNMMQEILIDSSLSNLYCKDLQGKLIAGNKTLANMLGLSSTAELFGKTEHDFYLDKKQLKKVMAFDEEVLDTRMEITREEIGINHKGELKTFLSKKAPIKDAKGKIIGITGASIDITGHKNKEQPLIMDVDSFVNFYKQFKLGKREAECLYFLVRGMTGKEIGKELSISYRTVETYLDNVKEKLNRKTKQSLIARVFEIGID